MQMLQWQWHDLGAAERTRKLYLLETTFGLGVTVGKYQCFPRPLWQEDVWSKSLRLQALCSTEMEGVPHRAQLLLTAATKQPSACVVSSRQIMFVSSGKCTHFPSQTLESFHRVPVLFWGTIKKTIPPRHWSSTARAPSGACRTHQLQNNTL